MYGPLSTIAPLHIEHKYFFRPSDPYMGGRYGLSMFTSKLYPIKHAHIFCAVLTLS